MDRVRFLLVSSAFLLASFLVCAPQARADKKKELDATAKDLAQNMTRLNLHKIYVPDFLDEIGSRTDRSAFWAADFSKALLARRHDFEVLDRAVVQKSYENLGVTPADLRNPEALVKIGKGSGADAILFGRIVESTSSSEVLLLSVRDANSANALFSLQRNISKRPSDEGYFPALSDPTGKFFHFPGYDGISELKCVRCPDPSYTDSARRDKVQGNVVLTAIFTTNGKLTDIRVIHATDQSLGQASIEALRTWKFEPAKDAAGNPITVRVGVETTFRLF